MTRKLFIAALIVVLLPTEALAIDDRSFMDNGIYFLNRKSAACNEASSTGVLAGDNVEKTLKFLTSKGLTLLQAAAIAGNLQQESTFNPTIENEIGAYGIAQWLDGRKANLQKKTNYDKIETQLEFLWEELNGPESASLTKLQGYSRSNVGELAVIFGESFERYGPDEEGSRAKYAEEILNAYKGKIADGSPSTASASAGSSDGCGGLSDYGGDNFPIYNQCDPQWGSSPYANGATICSDGCGPSAMAMIITAMTGKKVTPADTVPVAAAAGMHIAGVGSRWEVSELLANKWGLKEEKLKKNIDSINRELKNGAIIITSGSGPAPFAEGGHYITIRAITGDGKWKVAHSAVFPPSDDNTKNWDPNEIFPYMREGNVRAIKKR